MVPRNKTRVLIIVMAASAAAIFTTFAVIDLLPASTSAQGRTIVLREGSRDAGATAIRSHDFLGENGIFTTIDVPAAMATSPTGIKNRALIIGLYGDAAGKSHAFLLNQGVLKTFEAPGATLATLPLSINNHGRSADTATAYGAMDSC